MTIQTVSGEPRAVCYKHLKVQVELGWQQLRLAGKPLLSSRPVSCVVMQSLYLCPGAESELWEETEMETSYDTLPFAQSSQRGNSSHNAGVADLYRAILNLTSVALMGWKVVYYFPVFKNTKYTFIQKIKGWYFQNTNNKKYNTFIIKLKITSAFLPLNSSSIFHNRHQVVMSKRKPGTFLKLQITQIEQQLR